MSVGKANCKCTTCGSFFEKIKKCYNSKQAAEFVEFAEGYYDECPKCYSYRIKKENEEKADEIIKNYNLPEITGVSEKQINYAVDFRNRYLGKHKADIDSMQEQIEKAKILVSEKYNGDIDALINDNCKAIDPDMRSNWLISSSSKSACLLVFLKLCTMSSANEIIKYFT